MNQKIQEYYIEGMYILLCSNDLPDNLDFSGQIVAIDTELNRDLNPKTGKLCLVQVKAEKQHTTYLVKYDLEKPIKSPNLAKLMEDEAIPKLLHFAKTDMEFIAYHLNCSPKNLLCTKLASKVIRGLSNETEHNLVVLVKEFLGVSLSKETQQSKWENETLTEEQIKYASLDVKYLHELWFKMLDVASEKQVQDVLAKCKLYHEIVREELADKKKHDPYYNY